MKAEFSQAGGGSGDQRHTVLALKRPEHAGLGVGGPRGRDSRPLPAAESWPGAGMNGNSVKQQPAGEPCLQPGGPGSEPFPRPAPGAGAAVSVSACRPGRSISLVAPANPAGWRLGQQARAVSQSRGLEAQGQGAFWWSLFLAWKWPASHGVLTRPSLRWDREER